MADVELQEAIDSAVTEIVEDGKKAGTLVEEPQTEEVEDDEEVESDDEPQIDLNEVQLKEAQLLYKALLDPNTSQSVIAALAAKSGILTAESKPETKAEVREAKKDLLSILKQALPEFPHITEKLGPAIEEYLNQERSERETELQDMRLNQIQNDVDKTIESLRKETKGASKAFENKMAQLSDKIVAAPGTSIEEYTRMLYAIASAGSKTTQATVQIADKIRRNATNAHDRTRGSSGTESSKLTVPDKKMNLNQSINWAIEQASMGRKIK